MKIITMTLNPAYDLHLSADSLRPGRDNSARMTRRDAGGKGVNLSRALLSFGVESIPYLIVGEESARDFTEELLRDGLSPIYDTVPGRVRENINIHADEDTVISTDGTPITASDMLCASAHVLPLVDSETYLVFSGSIPKGSDKTAIFALLSEACRRGAKLILDSRSLTLKETLDLSPFLIKPNLGEAEALLGKKLTGIREAASAACSLYKMANGRIANILLTAGSEGAVLVTESGVYRALTPRIEAVSSVGAGDSTVAGFLIALGEGRDDPERLRLATAFGTAACLAEGSRPPEKEKIREMYEKVEIVSE